MIVLCWRRNIVRRGSVPLYHKLLWSHINFVTTAGVRTLSERLRRARSTGTRSTTGIFAIAAAKHPWVDLMSKTTGFGAYVSCIARKRKSTSN